MRVLVCGGRDYQNKSRVDQVLQQVGAEQPITTIIHGAARGADQLGEAWGLRRGIRLEAYPADWSRFGLSAGPRRNQEMLTKGQPDLVVAFPGGRGTADMVRRSRRAGIRVIEV
jgi:hypothetical protein